jgi:hypothetical protein
VGIPLELSEIAKNKQGRLCTREHDIHTPYIRKESNAGTPVVCNEY